MPRFLVTERTYVDAIDEDHAMAKVQVLIRKDRTAERVAPELEVGMPVRLVSRKHRPAVRVPVGSQGVVVTKEWTGSVSVVFHARHEIFPERGPWTWQYVKPADLEVVEGWSS